MLPFLKRVFRESIPLHLLLPLVVSVAVGTIVGFLRGDVGTVAALAPYWWQRLPELLAIYFTFMAVLLLVVAHETAIRMANMGTLDDVLVDSSDFFAFGALPLNKWFEPSVQVYLARIVAKQKQVPTYSHERVLLFFSAADVDAAHATYLDEYHARCLIQIHKIHGITLAFLRPESIREVLKKMNVVDRKALGCYWRPIAMFPTRLLERAELSLVRRRIGTLAFAVVGHTSGPSIIRFYKGRRKLEITKVHSSNAGMGPFLRFTEHVKELIHTKSGTLSPEYDFAKHMEI